MNMASGEWMFVYFTHVEDGLRSRQGPFLTLWGQKDRSVYMHMERTLGALSPYLTSSHAPKDLAAFAGETIAVLINNTWVRGRLVDTNPSPHGVVDVFCIDFGSVQSIPLPFIRKVDPNAAPEASVVFQCQPLAQKYILADVVSSQDLWPDNVIRFVKAVLENQTWRAFSLGTHGNGIGVRLYNEKNELLAKTMIDNGMGIPAQSYSATKNVLPVIDRSGPTFSSYYPRPRTYPPARVSAPTLHPRINQIHSARLFLHPTASSGDKLQLPTPSVQHVGPGSTRSVSPQQSVARREVAAITPLPPAVQSSAQGPSTSSRAYIASDMKLGMMYEVIVTNIEDGIRKFSVQLKESESELRELRQKLDCVELRTMKNPTRGSPCLALFSQDQLLHRGLVTHCQDDKCSVYYIDYGNLEVLDSRYIFEIPDDLMSIKLHACRVGLADSEGLEHLDKVSETFSSIVFSKSFHCQVIESDRPQKVVMYDEHGRSVKDLILAMLNKNTALSKKSYSPSQLLAPPPKSSICRDQKAIANQATGTNVTRMPIKIARQSIQLEEQLYVTYVLEVGKFFGQLERLTTDELDSIQAELLNVYGALKEPPLLYADVTSHLGDSAVAKWSRDGQFYRIKIQEEFVNDVQVAFVDYGNVLKLSKRDVLAPVNVLSLFSKPAFGIFCQLPPVTVSSEQWEMLMVDQPIQVKIVERKDDLYSVIFTNHPMNKNIADALEMSAPSSAVSQSAVKARPPVYPSTQSSWEASPAVSKTQESSVQTFLDTPPAVRAQTFSSWDTPPVVSNTEASSAQTFFDTPPAVSNTEASSAQTFFDTPPAVRAPSFVSWDTPPDAVKLRSEPFRDTPSAPVKQPIIASRDTPPSNPQSTNDQSGRAIDNDSKKASWNNPDGQHSDWRRPGSRFGAESSQSGEEGKIDKNRNTSNGQAKRVSWGKTETGLANLDTNWRSSNMRMTKGANRDLSESRSFGNAENREWNGESGGSRPRGENRPPRLNFNLQPTTEKQPTRISPILSPTPLTYLGQTVLTNVTKTVEVVYVNSPIDFYCQLSEAIEPLDLLMNQLSNAYEGGEKPSVPNPKKGVPCVAQYVDDSAWYRGLIVAVDNQDAEVLFVDYGNTQKTRLVDLKVMEKTFLALPPQAYRCCLTAIKAQGAWSVEDKQKFEDMSMSKQLKATFTKKAPDGKYHVRLAQEDGNEVTVLNETYGAPSSRGVLQPTGSCVGFDLPTDFIDVTVAWFYHSCKFFLAPTISDEHLSKLDQLDEFYSSLDPQELSEDAPRVKLLCVARFAEDQRFYRSEIIDIHNDLARVLFVDYGNEQDDTPLKSLKRIVPDFLTFPKLTLPCQIKDVKRIEPPKSDYQKYEAACFVSGGNLTAFFDPPDSNGFHPVNVVAKKIGNVRDYLIGNGVVEPKVGEFVKLPEASYEYVHGQEIAAQAIIPFLKSASEFWIQAQPNVAETLMAQIVELASKEEFASSTLGSGIAVGRFCLARYPEDDIWYRAVIKSVDLNKITVNYVDYGNDFTVDTSELRELPVELSNLPPQAIKCSLDGIEYSGENVDEAFSSIYDTAVFSAKFVKMVDDRLVVRLFDLSDGTDLNRKLGVPDAVEIYISYTESPRLFWAQLKSSESDLAKIEGELSTLDSSDDALPSPCPAEDQVYAVKHPEYESWYRAKLSSVDEDRAIAHFIDYGDRASVSLSDVRNCPESIRDLVPMALKCGLKLSVPPELNWSEGPVIALLKATNEDILRAVFCGEQDDVKLVQALMTKEQDLVKIIEEVVLNSTSKQSSGELWRASGSCDQAREASEGADLATQTVAHTADEAPVEKLEFATETGADVKDLEASDADTTENANAPEESTETCASDAPDEHSTASSEATNARAETTDLVYDPCSLPVRRNSVAEKVNMMETLIREMANGTSLTSPEVAINIRSPATASSTELKGETACSPLPDPEPHIPVAEQNDDSGNLSHVEDQTMPEDGTPTEDMEPSGTEVSSSTNVKESGSGENSEVDSVIPDYETDLHPEINEVEVDSDVPDVPVEIRIDAVTVATSRAGEDIGAVEDPIAGDVAKGESESTDDGAANEEAANGNPSHGTTEEDELQQVLDVETEQFLEEHLDVHGEELQVNLDPLDLIDDLVAGSLSPKQAEGNGFEDSWEPQQISETLVQELESSVEGDVQDSEALEREPQPGQEPEINALPIANGDSNPGAECVAAEKIDEIAKDLPLPYDNSYDEEDKNAATAVPEVTYELPPPDHSFKQNTILSCNCSMSYCNGADDFWLQFNIDSVARLMGAIDEYSTTEEFTRLPPFRVAIGRACLSFYKDEEMDPGMWHRGVISSINGDVATVFYSDFGNSCPVRISELKSLPKRLAVLPPLASHCTLDGIEFSEIDLTDEFVNLFWVSTPVTVKFRRMKAGKYAIRLIRNSDHQDLGMKLGLRS